MKTPTISIVIPLYNSEKYIYQCLQSIQKQKFKNFEVLIIDDGSTDNSVIICKSFISSDNRFRLYCKENGGVSTARNLGIKEALSVWICFIDSDDWLEEEYLSNLLSKQKKNVDLIACSFNENINGTKLEKKYPEKEISAKELQWKLFYNQENLYYGYLWNKIFKREIVLKNRIMFHEDLFYNEDRIFIFEYSLFCKNVVQTDKCHYNYRIHNNNSMGKLFSNINKKTISELESYCYLLKNENISEQLKKTISKNAEHVLSKFYIKAQKKDYQRLHQYGYLYLKYNFNYIIWLFIHCYFLGYAQYTIKSILREIKHRIYETL